MNEVICRGSYLLGTACGRCSRCKDEIIKMQNQDKSIPKPETMNKDIVKEDYEIFRFSNCDYVLHEDYKKLLDIIEELQKPQPPKTLIVKEAIEMANGPKPCWFVASQMIRDLAECVEGLQKFRDGYHDILTAYKDAEKEIKEQSNKITKLEAVVDAAKELMNFSECQYIYDKECGNLVDRSRSAIKLLDALSELGGSDG